MGFILGGNLAAAANSGLFLLLMRSGWELPLSRACVVSVIAPLVSTAVGGGREPLLSLARSTGGVALNT